MRSTVILPLLIAAACNALGACAGVKTQSTTGSGGTNGGVDGSVGPNQDANVSFDFGTPDIMIAPPHSECGDGTRSQDEACDDHNVTGRHSAMSSTTQFAMPVPASGSPSPRPPLRRCSGSTTMVPPSARG